MRFLVDAQLPVQLVKLFAEAGHDAIHVADVGLLTASDSQIRRYATREGMIIVTKDEDFAIMRRLSARGPGVLWIRLGNTTNRALSARLRPAIAQIFAAFAEGDSVVELR